MVLRIMQWVRHNRMQAVTLLVFFMFWGFLILGANYDSQGLLIVSVASGIVWLVLGTINMARMFMSWRKQRPS